MFVSVPLNGEFAVNVDRDTVAADIVFKSGVPIVCIPATRQKMTGCDEAELRSSNTKIAQFLTRRLDDWRKYKQKNEPDFLERTGQLEGMGKNLWSLPVFVPDSLAKCFGICYENCDADYDGNNSVYYIKKTDGPDKIMISWDERKVIEYMLDQILKK